MLMHPDANVTCACGCGEKTHFKSLREGYNKWIKGHSRRKHRRPLGPPPLCACGCGMHVEWLEARGRYNTYVHGHNTRGKPSPLKGYTKETHVKFKRQSETILSNAQERRRRSLQLKKLHENSKIPTGRQQHNWKGSTASLGDRLSGHPRLYSEWKLPKLREAGFACQLCHSTNELHVHHDDEAMHAIVARYVDDVANLSVESKREIANQVVDYHVENDVHATVLCGACHRRVHAAKGYITSRSYVDEIADFIRRKELACNVYQLSDAIHVLKCDALTIAYGDLFRATQALMSNAKCVDTLCDNEIGRGTNFLYLFEDEWRDKRAIVESMINARLGNTLHVYDARKCIVSKLGQNSADRGLRREFFNTNHIDGDVGASHTYALVYDNTPVMMLSLRKPKSALWRRNGYMEIARSSSLLNSRVRGGLSRLIRACRRDVGTDIPLMTYVDRRHGQGNSYISAGFKHAGITHMPRFWWTDFTTRYDRLKYRADKDRGMTELQVASAAGVHKIWGCKNTRFVLE